MNRSIAFSVLVFTNVFSLAPASDAVSLRIGSQLTTFRGQILSENAQELSMLDDQGRSMPGLSWKQIVAIEWDIPHFEWHRGMRAYKDHDYALAAGSFKRLEERHWSGFRDAARSTLLFHYAESLRRIGDWRKSCNVYERLLKEYPKSKYYAEASEGLADLYLAVGDSENLFVLVSALSQRDAARCDLYRAHALLLSGETETAEGLYERISSISVDRELSLLASLGQGRCANRLGNTTAARSFAAAAINASGATPEVFALAHLVLGNSLLAEARIPGDAAEVKTQDAALEFLRVCSMYPQFIPYAAEAAYRSGECFQLLARASNTELNRFRAHVMYKKVLENYSESSWAAEASKNLQRL